MFVFFFSANLSNDYFKNRQDRYFMIENCGDLCDFYSNLVETIAEFSFELLPDGSTCYSDRVNSHPFRSGSEEFADEASERIGNLFKNEINRCLEKNKTGLILLI